MSAIFNCSKCGLCCCNLKNSDIYNDLNDGTGVCIHFDKKSKLCKIYEYRPEKCNVDAMYKYFRHLMTLTEYYELNYAACQQFQLKGEK